MKYSEEQQDALERILRWRKTLKPGRTFALGGLAGTGKTTLVSDLAGRWKGAAVAALCGKAADVLRSKGVRRAQTLHSLLYVAEQGNDGKVHFVPRDRLVLEDGPAQEVIVDEASMVPTGVLEDLLAHNLPVLFVGDHGQLEPVGDDPGIMKSPDIRLEKIHRQAEGNPILEVAYAFREGREPATRAEDRRVRMKPASDFRERGIPWAVNRGAQVIVGFNQERHWVNEKIREIRGFEGQVPVPGERVICLQNNRELGIFNGQIFDVLDCRYDTARTVAMTLQEDGDKDSMPIAVIALTEQFGQNKIQNHRDSEICLFDFAYALTAHKSQGSEFPAVLALEQAGRTWDMRRLRYTVATRAKEELVYCGYRA